jgi:teichuronic acid biosynthesis glycosyltransferase TuaG
LSTHPLVSIIIPTFNRCDYLTETVASILKQTYVHFELIIISDRSSDETALAVQKMADPRCRFYELPVKSNGPAYVRNFGVTQSNGSLIAFCDDDDLWLPTKLETQVNYLLEHPSTDLVATNITYFGQGSMSSAKFGRIKNSLNNLPFLNPKYLITLYNCIVISSSVVRKNTLIEAGAFNEGEEYQRHEDIDLWIKICAAGNAHIIPKHLTLYRVHRNQWTATSNYNYKKQSLAISQKHYPTFNFPQKCLFNLRLLVYRLTGQ